jgi:alpha-galactosidase
MAGKRIVLVGAGSAQFGLGTLADVLLSDVLGDCTLVLHDINPDSLEMVRRACQMAIDEKKLELSIEATTSRPEAFRGADFIIISIEVGDRFKIWEQDYEIPRKYGSKQIFGENGGPGGLFHSLRIIPPVIEICKDVQKICPNALVFNFSNPMHRICLAIKRKFNNRLKVIGLCHEVQDFLYLNLQRMINTPYTNLDIKSWGLNHFAVLLKANYKDTGKDAYPEIREKAPDYLAKGRELGVAREILRIYGYLPTTTDSHFGEYVQWAWEVANLKDVRAFYEIYKADTLQSQRNLKSIVDGKRPTRMWLNPSGERPIPIIEGIMKDSKHTELAVNVPNEEGIIENLPRDLVIECPARVDKNGVHPIKLGDMPKGLAALMRNQATVQDLVVEAALNGSKELALQGLLADPVVDSANSAQKMLDEVLKLQQPWLGYIK